MNVSRVGRVMAIAVSALIATGAAHAVYRCGNVYQDRPCDDNGPQPHLTPGVKAAPHAPSPATAASPFAAACSRVGEEAQRVAWKREGGATQDKLLAEATSDGSRAVIESVYRRRGTAPEIRAALEAECVAERQKEADDAAAVKQLLQFRQAAAAASTPTPAAGPASAASSAAGPQKTARTDLAPSPSCPGWRSELGGINADFRKGGSAVAMEQLQNRRRILEQSLRDGHC